jgi:hypothetical protein
MLLVFLVFNAPGSYADAGGEWEFRVAPYLWVAGQEGKVATLPGTPPVDLDVSFSDILKELDMALMGTAEARKGRFGVFGEVFFTRVSPDAKTPGAAFSKVAYDQELWTLSAGGFYILSQAQDHNLDAVIGVRRWDLDNDLTFKDGLLPGFKVSGQESWNDVFVGLKGRKALDDRWFINGWGYVAVSGDSDSYWDLFAGVGYKFNAFALDVGYRHQVVDFNENGFIYDIKISGPTVGFVFEF